MFLSLLAQNFLAFAWFSVPFVILYARKPKFTLSAKGALVCSVLLALRFFAVGYYQSNNVIKGLKYAPTGKSREYFDNQIKKVGLNPDTISLRYGYCDKSVACTIFNTVVIDQMLWRGMGSDPMRTTSKKIVKNTMQPSFGFGTKQFHKKLKNALTPDVQRFVFKHELGHVVDSYSLKSLLLTGVIACLSVYSGFYVVQSFIVAYGGFVSLCAGIGVTSTVYLILSYLSNALFKAPKEKEADMFAAKHSTKREIEAAANFFEKYEQYSKEYRKTVGDTYSGYAPKLLMGYCSGEERVQYLRNAAQSQ